MSTNVDLLSVEQDGKSKKKKCLHKKWGVFSTDGEEEISRKGWKRGRISCPDALWMHTYLQTHQVVYIK
jgi:hypothetical protein